MMKRHCRAMVLAMVLALSWLISGAAWGQNVCPPGRPCPLATVSPNMAPRMGRSSPAADYHRAIVRVEAGDGPVRSAGSGTLVYHQSGVGVVLTAAHVTQGQQSATAIWTNGYSSRGLLVCSDPQADIAAFLVTPPDSAITIPIAGDDQWPRQGDIVEMCGYGGGPLRHWFAPVKGYAQSRSGKHHTLSVATQTISGDSGGPIVFNGKLVAVLWGGPLAGPSGPMIATHGTYCERIRAILGGCRRLPRLPISPATQPPLVEVEPATSGPLPPDLQNQLTQLQAELARLRLRISELSRLPGPAGPPGQDGEDGEPGSDGRDTAIDLDRLAEAVKRRIAGSIRIKVQTIAPPELIAQP